MDNSEEAQLCRFGTPLEPLEEDDVPSKKSIQIEDQIVTDENGRRRFHGAFTGGFSAGFWNTVGSLEGWKPQSFKSSRTEKAERRQRQLPTDFMDDEDLGEFGIAPQRVQAREDFAKTDETANRKRKLVNRDSGPIPGIPVLQQLLEPSREKVAIRLLRHMGWKPGQGIGARQTKKEKTRSNERNNRELYVIKRYGCDIDPNVKLAACASEESSGLSEEDEAEEITFAPDDFEPFVCSIKGNTYGLGYSGLSRQLASDSKSHINLFSPLEVMGKSNNVLSIRGQAFGVGALEEEDEDIYAKDDMSKYDFSLDKKKREKQKLTSSQLQSVLAGFAEASNSSNLQNIVHRLELKSSFQPRNWLQRKTRFEPVPEEKTSIIKQGDAFKKRGLGRHDLGPDERGSILDERIDRGVEIKKDEREAIGKNQSYLQHISKKYKEREVKSIKMLELLLSSKADNFVKGGLITNSGVEIQSTEDKLSETVKMENQKIMSDAKEITKSLGSSLGTFRPFASYEAKQERYEKFIGANLRHEDEIKAFLATIQPVHLSEWDREMERKEFVQARNIYKPLNGLMSERFVSKSNVSVPVETSKTQQVEKAKVIVVRMKKLWKPCALICKRFNIAEPFGGTLVEPKIPKKNKFSVFDYIENSINSKKDFVTPIIIPKHIEKPKAIQSQVENLGCSKERISPKELLTGESVGPSISIALSQTDDIQTRQTLIKNRRNPKTELESRVEASKNKHPSEKKDLFRCIFDSSDDDTNNDDEADDQNPQNISKTTVSDEIVKTLIKPSAPVNILRHNSPPRGIFAALFSNAVHKEETPEANIGDSSNLDKVTFKPKRERDFQHNNPGFDDTYGPKLPTNLIIERTTTTTANDIDKKIIELMSAKPTKASKVIESWVEKSDKSRKKSKKEKKETKKKDHKKKSKTKHKKSKKHKRK